MLDGISFEVAPASDDEFFFRALSNTYCPADQVKTDHHAQYLIRYLRDLEVKTLVLEYEYTDGDYLDDFASYYVKCWEGYNRRCRRLHAFAAEFDRDQFLAAVRTRGKDTIAELLRENYRGFIVARPLPDAIVGRTVLATYPPEGGRRNYKAVQTYHANLFGIALSVTSLPYQEQDTVLAACATVALWSCFHRTAHLYGTRSPRSPTPAEITRAANSVIRHTRPIPSHGLSVEQICSAIRHVDLEPEVFSHPAQVPLVSLIYGYVRAGVPVLLGFDVDNVGHAVAVIGYSQQPTPVRAKEGVGAGARVPLFGLRIDEFYAHDDGVGPFSRLKIIEGGERNPVTFQGDWKDDAQQPLPLTPIVVIVPVYHKIRVTFVDAYKWVTRLHLLLAALAQKPDISWDLHLIGSNDLKSELVASAPGDVIEETLLMSHPRFAWRAELRAGDKRLMWFLADATDMERSCPVYRVVWEDALLLDTMRQLFGDVQSEPDLIELLTGGFFKKLRASLSP